MTAREKAKELINKYKNLNVKFSNFIDDYLFVADMIIKMKDNQSKQCALIAVDEILSAITFNMYDEDAYNKEEKYWYEVKQEIEKL